MKPAIFFRPMAALALVVGMLLQEPAVANDLGVRGATWPIAEPDLLVEIEARLAAMSSSGEMARIEREARRRARSHLEEPATVPGIAPAREARSRAFDPAILVDRDIRAPDGTLVAAAGTRIDPLRHMPLTRDLLFIDGRRDAEVEWALAHGRAAKIVLLAGRPLELARRHDRPFFFDQGGRLAARFGLVATPSLVTRDGARLRIDEVALEDRDGSRGDDGAAR